MTFRGLCSVGFPYFFGSCLVSERITSLLIHDVQLQLKLIDLKVKLVDGPDFALTSTCFDHF